MIWQNMESNLSSSLGQPHLPSGSSLNADTFLPSCICTGDSPAQREVPPDTRVDVMWSEPTGEKLEKEF